MKITKITGNAFVNTLPAVVGQDVSNMDMIDARQAQVTLDTGTVLDGICTRLVDQGVGVITEGVVQDTSIPTPTVSEPEPTSSVTSEVAQVVEAVIPTTVKG